MELKNWREKLLDLGKGNKLINYKEQKLNSLDIIYPSSDKIFQMLMNSNRIEFFDVDKLNEDGLLTSSEVLKKAKDKMKVRQVLTFKKDIKLKQVLKEIMKRTKEYQDEKGINVLYMAFGFLEVHDILTPNIAYNAPIILVPIKITNHNLNEPFYLELFEEEAILNPTLSYFLTSEYKIKLKEFEQENLFDYFEYVKKNVDSLKWAVSNNCSIGLFSFLKINMYKDLKDNEDICLANNNVRNMLGMDLLPEEKKIEKANLGFNNVVDADSSQLEAIKAIKNGESIVLQGPPGTGKSQTITNIIAECLADNKKVLFVSEKLAALNVVFRNLKKAELEEFSLALHSHKTNKKELINELYETFKTPKTQVKTDIFNEMIELQRVKEQLDEYAFILHEPIPLLHKSPYDIYSEIAYLDNVKEYDILINSIEEKDCKYLNDSLDLIYKYVNYTETVGFNYKMFPWYGYIVKDDSLKTKTVLKNEIQKNMIFVNKMIRLSNEVKKRLNLKIDTYKEVLAASKMFELLSKMNVINEEFFNIEKLDGLINNVKKLEDLSNGMLSRMKMIDACFVEQIYDNEYKILYNRFIKEYSSFFRFLNKDYRKDIKYLRSLQISTKKIKYKMMVNLLSSLVKYQDFLRQFNEINPHFIEIMNNEYKGINTNWKEFREQLEMLKNSSNEIADYESFKTPDAFDLNKPLYKKYALEIEEILIKKDEYLAFQEKYDRNVINFEENSIKKLYNYFDSQTTNYGYFDIWNRFLCLFDELREKELLKYINDSIELVIPTNQLMDIYKKAFYINWTHYIFSNNKVLGEFNRIVHDRLVALFVEKDHLQFEISKARIKSKLEALKPNADIITAKSPASILAREYQKERKQMSVRELLNTMPEFIQLLKPCFLMSPLSVSTYLNSKFNFDIVIFDEASQIFPQDALGSIYRAKQVVVVGDSKQMPPSNFFMNIGDKNADDEFDEEDVADYESILDVCSTVFRQYRLKWHYRSRNEELIAFSNKNFYSNELVTFPSAKKRQTDFGVDFYYVENGIFDRRTKKNNGEAQVVAKMVMDHYKKYKNTRSLGVVAFSLSQQTAIEKEINLLRSKDYSLEAYFENDGEPFFIKNLETVQGDERDTIIFSVGYAKDETGRFIHNFGPLNRSGGERRLNVAITRAKINVKLVSSIKSFDIDLSKSQQTGTKLLKEYLEYAENGNVINVSINNNVTVDFTKEVKDFLTSEGYIVDLKVGTSICKIDLAVKHPKENRYILGIEVDGLSYRDSKNTRDRDRLRSEVLEKFGWNMYRIWSTDWYKNNRVEKEQLLDEIKKALSNESNSKKITQTTMDDFLVEKKDSSFEVFEFADDEKILKSYKTAEKDFHRIIMEFLKVEAPMNEEYLLKRIVSIFDLNKVVASVRRKFAENKHLYLNRGDIIFKNGFIYLSKAPIKFRVPNGKPRDIKNISFEEIANGMFEIISQNKSVEKMDLYRSLATLMGYSRMGDNIIFAFDKAKQILMNNQSIFEDKDIIMIVNK